MWMGELLGQSMSHNMAINTCSSWGTRCLPHWVLTVCLSALQSKFTDPVCQEVLKLESKHRMGTKYTRLSKPSLAEQIENINKNKWSEGVEGVLEMFTFLKKMKKIPICGVLNTTQGKKKRKNLPTLWRTGKKLLKPNIIIHDGVKTMWS